MQVVIVKADPSGEANATKRLWAKLEEAQAALYDKRRTNLLEVEQSKAAIEALKQEIEELQREIEAHRREIEELQHVNKDLLLAMETEKNMLRMQSICWKRM